MQTSCSSWSYHRTIDEGKMDQMGFIEQCGKLGLDGVELLVNHFPSRDRDYLCKLKKACTDRYLTIAMVSANGHLTCADDAERAGYVKEIGEWVETAVFLGAPIVRFFCGSGPELEDGGEERYQKVLAATREVVSFGEREGIVMAMENHGNTTADQLLRLVEDVGSDYFKLTLDIGNFPPHSTWGDHVLPSIERTAPLAAAVHAKFFNVTNDGQDADFDWPAIHGVLKSAGFKGFLSIEYEGQDADEVGCVQRIARYLTTLR